ncbi:hypothetical protein HDE76_004137, partial [Rhodanobacter sp. ANJX3]|uniref:hypothetical protein n=1 Tax=Rhodanobacter sp. ANJX3 TaxID=2723083 RepID=UPI001618A9F8
MTACLFFGVSQIAMAQQLDGPHSSEQINGPPPTATPLPKVFVTDQAYKPFDISSTWGQGFSLTPGSGGAISWANGHLFSFNNPNNSSTDPKKDPNGGPCSGNYQGAPIDVSKGTKLETYTLFSLPGEMGLKYELYYHNRGINPWSDDSYYSLDTACGYDPNYNGGPCPGVKFYRADGSTILFNGTAGKGPFTESGAGNLATLTYNSASATYTLQDEDATTKVFSSNG